MNNAGYGLYSPIEKVTEAQFDGLMDVHLKGPFFLTQALLPLLKKGAGIVNLTSATTRVNAVSPGAIRTELGGLNAEFESMLASQTALGRVGEPVEVARVIATLLTEDGQWVNAQSIEVADGYTV